MLAKGARLGSYQIVALIGVGGMGEVYRARDTRLGREVAIKVLPREVAADADRLARFEREARVLATLNHPNIATLHGVEEGEQTALVMELVDGETLAQVCDRRQRTGRPLPVADALAIARQIAAAIEAAHGKSIVHRDLKPANIKVGANGVVKVLDFGIARVLAPKTASDAPDPAVTMVADATRAGFVLGTTPYMSPEQARGAPADESADVWAFACVLYELLTGRRAFAGATDSDTIAAVLEHDPDWTPLPTATPGFVARLLRRCLHKDPSQRLRNITAVRVILEEADGGAESEAPRPERLSGRPARFAWLGAGVIVAVVGLGAVGAYQWTRPQPPGEAIRLAVTAPGPISAQLSGLISPDGKHVAFVATGPSGRAMLWVRSLDSLEPRELAGTDRAAHPCWSPDSRSLAFVADAKLKRVELAGGPVQTLADLDPAWRSGSTWSGSGVILFGPKWNQLATVPAAGGPVTIVLEAAQGALWWPDFLPDGRHFLYYADAAQPGGQPGVSVGSLDSAETKFLLASDMQAKYAAPGYLLSLRDETLMAQAFDATRLELSGEPRAVADGIWFARGARHAAFSASRTGTLAYVNATWWDKQLVWFDRGGHRTGTASPPFRDALRTPQLAPDGRRVAVGRGEYVRGDIWILDSTRDAWSRVTFNEPNPTPPVWDSSGQRLLVRSSGKAVVHNVQDGTEEAPIDIGPTFVADWSKDGRFILLYRGIDLWLIDLAGDRQAVPYIQTPAAKTQAQLSPNGRWVAYTSNESGHDEVYVQSFPAAGHKRQISTDGGVMPRWRADGREFFFLAVGQMLTAVPITDPASLELGQATALFRAPLIVQGSEAGGLPTTYDVSADGERFLLDGDPENPSPPMTVVLNWRAALTP